MTNHNSNHQRMMTFRRRTLRRRSGPQRTDLQHRPSSACRTAGPVEAKRLQITDGTSEDQSGLASGPNHQGQSPPGDHRQHTTTLAGNSDSADPYAPPFDLSELGKASDSGSSSSPGRSDIGVGNHQRLEGCASGSGDLGEARSRLRSADQHGINPKKSRYTVVIAVRPAHDDGMTGTRARLRPTRLTVTTA